MVRKKVSKSPKKKVAVKRAAKKTQKVHGHHPDPAHELQHAISRSRVYNLTKDIPEHQFFILANGQPVKNVAELAALMDQLEDHVFHHHVTPDRNDFHNWVADVFDDLELARKITGIKDKKHMQLVMYRHIAGHD